MSKTEKINNDNCAATRDAIRDYVRKRVSGECKSDVAGNSDILSAMLESSEIFDEDDVIDELMDLMLAGTQTTHNTTQFALAHLMTDPESLARVRAEFDDRVKGREHEVDKVLKDSFDLD